jgi:hypothetical protein
VKKEHGWEIERVYAKSFIRELGFVRKSGGFASALKSKSGPPRKAGPTRANPFMLVGCW